MLRSRTHSIVVFVQSFGMRGKSPKASGNFEIKIVYFVCAYFVQSVILIFNFHVLGVKILKFVRREV